MEIQSANGECFSFVVDRYEFPHEPLGPTEDNPAGEDFDTGRFLVISCEFENHDGKWSGSFPEMDTTGLARLIQWLDSINRDDIMLNGVHFVEYNLEFSVDETRTVLHVHAFNHFLPPWIAEGESITLRFPIADINLTNALAALRAMAEQFPGRPPLGNAG